MFWGRNARFFLLPRLAKKSEGCFSCVPRWSSFQIGHGRNRSRGKVPAIRPVFPLSPHHYYIRRSLCQLRPRREKRIHRQHDEQCCRWILFFVEAQSAHPVCGRKNGEARRWRSESCAAQAGRDRKWGGAELKARRCVIEARGRIEKARRRVEKQRARNRKTRNRRIKAPEPKFERVRGSKSESTRTRNQKACNLPTTL